MLVLPPSHHSHKYLSALRIGKEEKTPADSCVTGR